MSLTSKETSKKYENTKEIDIDNEFSKMSSENQEEVRSIYEFTNFRNLYKRFYNVQNNLERIKERKFIVLNKSFSNSEECGTRAIHKNLVDFVVNNGICIEDYTEYKSINEKYFEISLINTRDNKWIPNKTELYTAIKYIKPKDMKNVAGCNLFTYSILVGKRAIRLDRDYKTKSFIKEFIKRFFTSKRKCEHI